MHMDQLQLAILGRLFLGFSGDFLGVAQGLMTCRWFEDDELGIALAINLAASRIGSILNDVLSPLIVYVSCDLLGLTERQGTLVALWSSVLFCFLSFVSAIVSICIDRYCASDNISLQTESAAIQQLYEGNTQYHYASAPDQTDSQVNSSLLNHNLVNRTRSYGTMLSKHTSTGKTSNSGFSTPQHMVNQWSGEETPTFSFPAHPNNLINLQRSLRELRRVASSTPSSSIISRPRMSWLKQEMRTGSSTYETTSQERIPMLLNQSSKSDSVFGEEDSPSSYSVEFWIIVAVMFLFYGSIVPFLNVVGDELQNTLYVSNNAIIAGCFLTIPDLLSTVLVQPAGAIMDRFKLSRIYGLAICGVSLAFVHATFLLPEQSASGSVLRIIALVVLGITYSFFLTIVWPLISLVVHQEQVASAYTVATSSFNLGLVFIPIIIASSIHTSQSVTDYSNMHYLSILMSLAGSCLCSLLVYSSLLQEDDGEGDSEDATNYADKRNDDIDYFFDEDNSGFGGRENVKDELPSELVSKYQTTARWVSEGTMYGTIMDDDLGIVVSDDQQYTALPFRRLSNAIDPLPASLQNYGDYNRNLNVYTF